MAVFRLHSIVNLLFNIFLKSNPWDFFQLSHLPSRNVMCFNSTFSFPRALFINKPVFCQDFITFLRCEFEFPVKASHYRDFPAHLKLCYTINIRLVGLVTEIIFPCSNSCGRPFAFKSIEHKMHISYKCSYWIEQLWSILHLLQISICWFLIYNIITIRLISLLIPYT